MKNRTYWSIAIAMAALGLFFAVSTACAADLIQKSCDELIRIAQSYREDIKTVEIVLGAAIDAGNLERIKSYKLKKNALKSQLEAVLKTVEVKDCARDK